MPEQKLVIAFLLLFSMSALFLFWQNDRQLDPVRGKDWWTLSFADPHEASDLRFTVENYTPEEQFTYMVLSEGRTLKEDSFTVSRGESVTLDPGTEAAAGARTTLRVVHQGSDRDLFRQ